MWIMMVNKNSYLLIEQLQFPLASNNWIFICLIEIYITFNQCSNNDSRGLEASNEASHEGATCYI
jgi:hypothetical protein